MPHSVCSRHVRVFVSRAVVPSCSCSTDIMSSLASTDLEDVGGRKAAAISRGGRSFSNRSASGRRSAESSLSRSSASLRSARRKETSGELPAGVVRRWGSSPEATSASSGRAPLDAPRVVSEGASAASRREAPVRCSDSQAASAAISTYYPRYLSTLHAATHSTGMIHAHQENRHVSRALPGKSGS